MRRFLRRYGSGTLLCLLGAALLLAGTGASLGYVAVQDAKEREAAQAREEAPATTGLEMTAVVHVETPLAPVDPIYLHLEPPAASEAAIPGFSVDRDLGVAEAGVGAGVDIDLATGSHRARGAGGSESVETSSKLAVLSPTTAAPAVVAVAALSIGGLVAYFWTSLKAWGAKHLILPLVGLYAKISRAEVFDNSVRERIFRAIRENPGLSASDLSRAADVSWGTTIYHLDVLEQTRMVTSLRQGRYRRYFENGATLAASKDAVAILRNPVTASVAEILRARPGVTQKELAGATNMTPQALHWHLTRLVATGLVRKEREGRVVRHFAVN